MAEHFASVSEDELCEKMYNKTIIEFGFRMISLIIKTSLLIIHAQPHPIIIIFNICLGDLVIRSPLFFYCLSKFS